MITGIKNLSITIVASVVFCGTFLLFFSTTHSQELTQALDISIQKTPENPTPNQVVSLQIRSFSVDLSQATIVWTYNGKQVAEGQGATSLSVVAPSAGNVGTVTATASGEGFSPLVATTTLSPGFVDLLWEGADASVPPFYKGRPLAPVGGIVRVVAEPVTSGVFSFSWKRNGSVVTNASGTNKKTFVFKNTPFESTEKIEVTAQSSTTKGESVVTILPREPFFVAYKKQSGFVDYATGSPEALTAKTNSLAVVFEPFFFSLPNDSLNDLVFSVKQNDEILYSDDAPNDFSFSNNSSGESALTISITPRAYTLQNITKSFKLLWN